MGMLVVLLSLLWGGKKHKWVRAAFIGTVGDLVLMGSAWGNTMSAGMVSAVQGVAVLVSALVTPGTLSVLWEGVGFIIGGMGDVVVGGVDSRGSRGGNLDLATRERSFHRAWAWRGQSVVSCGLFVVSYCLGADRAVRVGVIVRVRSS